MKQNETLPRKSYNVTDDSQVRRCFLSADYYAALTIGDKSLGRPVPYHTPRVTGWIEGLATGCNVSMAPPFLLPPNQRPLSHWSQSRAKRFFDCACILPVIPLLIPVLLAIALAVRLTSPGPVFFRQKRVGRYGRTFTIVKFRTLVHSPNFDHHAVTTESDRHFTPIGRFLRWWKLDELPQLFNVIRGDMSLVGPRPKVREHRVSVLRCRPGITGAATVAFAEEETVLARVPKQKLESCYRTVILPAKCRLDSEYMAHATVLSDFKLIVNSAIRRWDRSTIEDLLKNGAIEAEDKAQRSSAADPEDLIPAGAARANMKLAILGTRGIPAHYGGFETFAEQLATRLARCGIDVTVFCPSSSQKSDLTYNGVVLKYVKSPSLGKFTELVWDVMCYWVARRDFDVVYMLGVGAGFAAWIPRLYGSTVWINSDGVEWQRAKWTLPQRAYLAVAEALSVAFASRIVADADAIAEYLHKRYPRLKKVSTVAYGAEIPTGTPNQEVLDEWRLEPNGYYLVVCRLEPENNVLEIVQSFERTKSELPLVILGNVENPNAYVRRLLDCSSDRIRFAGTVYDNGRLNALRFFARAYFHGHSVGGTNPSLLEAMACSNLVIARDNPFNREVLGDSGLYWSTTDELTSIVNFVDEFRVDADTRRKRALEIVRSRYQWDHIADIYLGLLKDALNRNVTFELGELERSTFVPRTGLSGRGGGGIPVGDVARVPEGLG
jgi:lipopolysaccharide/colanic/teichoic acid biosynthesis glycosyltransferase/glycosyltransferase involved in cell wall biosynthesis